MTACGILKGILDLLLGSKAAYYASRRLYYSRLFPFVQAVTYHDTPVATEDQLRLQFEWYRENYVNCGLPELRELLTTGTWRHPKPGLIISFDDGLRSNFDAAVPLLEALGFTGWFMIPSGFVDLEPLRQSKFAHDNLIDFAQRVDGARIALSWDEIQEMERRGHVVTCHSMNHKRLGDELTEAELEVEIKHSKQMLESRLKHPIDSITWVGGEERAYGRNAFEMMLTARYSLIFCTNCAPIRAGQSPYFLQRYHVDPLYNVARLRLVLGGFYDIMYARKRRRVGKHLGQ